MIVDALFGVISTVMIWGGSLLPDGDLAAMVASHLSGWSLFWANAAAANYFFPLAEVAAVVLAVVFFLPVFLGASLVLWVISFVRGGSSRA